jgi:heterodisulfide reductase subunit A
MKDDHQTAIFFGGVLNGNADPPDIEEIISSIIQIPLVRTVWKSHEFPLTDAGRVAALIQDQNISRIIITGLQPGIYKSFFTEAMAEAGQDPQNVDLVSFKEYGIVARSDTGFAISVLTCAIYGLCYEEVIMPEEVPVDPATLVIGGGIAGIQAALEIANGRNQVYLVEKTGTIGGHMAMFDKTFPTLDCAACILTPKMVEVGQHPYIKLITYSEVLSIQGESGNFKVKILNKARRVSLSACIGCGTCAEKCPRTAPSEFDASTAMRKAIYIPFPQAVPNKYLIDAAHCTYVESGKCGVCAKVCPVPGCINLDEKDAETELTVGNIIIATGFRTFDPKRVEQYGYGKYPNVVSSIEFERLLNASGPTGGLIRMRTQDKKGNWIFSPESEEPQSVAIIHCIGSRDENYNKYCSRVCCMYSLKMAHLVREKLPQAEIYEYYIDIRAFGKGYEEFYERIRRENIHIVRGRAARVLPSSNHQLFVRTEDIEGMKILQQKVDMVVLSVGLEPHDDFAELVRMLGINTDEYGWFTESHYLSNPVDSHTCGIHMAGVCQGPKDIPDTVAQASAAAARVLQSIIKGKINRNIRHLSPQDVETKARTLSPLLEG